MPCVEQRLAVRLRRVFQQAAEEELVDEAGGTVAHRGRHLHERAQIVVDDHFARQAELLAVGVELVFRRLFDQAALLDLAVGGDRQQVAHVGQPETVVLLEVVQVAGRTQLGGNHRLGLVALEQFLVRDIRENPRQGNARKRGADGLVVEAPAVRDAVELHAFDQQLAERHIHFGHTGFDDLRPVTFLQHVGGDSDAKAHRRLHGFAKIAAFRFGLDGNAHAGGGAFGADGFEHLLRHDLGRPASGNRLAFDLRIVPRANSLDRGHPLALRFHGGDGGLAGGGGHIDGARLNRRGDGLGFR